MVIDIYTFISIAELLLYYFSALFISIKLLNSHYSHKRIILSSAIVFSILILECFLKQDYQVIINTFFPVVEITILKLFSLDFDLKNTIFTFVFIYFTNSIVTACIMEITNIDSHYISIIEITVCTVYFILITILCYGRISIKLRILIITTPTLVKVVLDALLLICCLLVVLIEYQTIFIDYLWSQIIRIIILLFVVVLSVSVPLLALYSSSSKYHKRLNDDYQKQIKAEAEYYSKLAEANFELRRFKHNYGNTSIGFKRLLVEGNAKEALELLESQNQEMEASEVPFDTGSGIVDALLSEKQKQAQKINTIITFKGDIPEDAIKAVDLCIIFGSTLDNAIEACEKMNSAIQKEIHIHCVCNSGFAFIEIKNPVQKKVEIHGNLPKTTKSNKELHGFGLYSLENVIKKYEGEVICKCDESTFTITMEFSIIKKSD